MRRATRLWVITAFLESFLAGCAAHKPAIQPTAYSNRDDIFSEVSGKGTIPTGYADLEIEASVKALPHGHFLFKAPRSVQGRQDYPFLLNVDGQAMTWRVGGRQETAPRYLEDGSKNPEGGTGIRYSIDRRIRLQPGTHHVYFGLPHADSFREVDVTLKAGTCQVLRFSPVYKLSCFARARDCTEGVSRLDMTMMRKCHD
jgi:hypothetical protein